MKGPTEDALPHVSEEAAATDRIMSKEKSCDGVPSTPELEQGTPISEVFLLHMFGYVWLMNVVADETMVDPPTRYRSLQTCPQSRAGYDEETVRR